MTQEYPKMLYKGNQENYQTAIADDEAHEAELLADDWIQYSDLPEQSENQYTGEAHSIDSAALVPVEQFDALALKVTELEQENAELRKQIRFKELEDMPADELKKLLDEAGVTYQARDGKPVLAQLVLQHETANPN